MTCPHTTFPTIEVTVTGTPPKIMSRADWESGDGVPYASSRCQRIWNRCCDLEDLTAWYHHRGRSAPEDMYDELAVRKREYHEGMSFDNHPDNLL